MTTEMTTNSIKLMWTLFHPQVARPFHCKVLINWKLKAPAVRRQHETTTVTVDCVAMWPFAMEHYGRIPMIRDSLE